MKKFLSLVLALVMAMSLVTVSAGAKDFTDSEKLSGEQYEEAVNVMSTMGIIDGYSDGSFQPQGTLTRGAAAKIIACMMLGKTTAEALGTQAAPFKDVPVGSTFAGYIAYCVESGIIDGYADGTFRPSNTLTGFAFLKMLLTALGYDSSIEGFTGTNWTVNVAGRAIEAGLTAGNEGFVGTKAATREEACLYAVNALKATLVKYETKGTEITINGATIATGASAPVYVTSSIYDAATSIDDTKDNASGDYTVEFAEKYQPKLRLTDDTDAFGRPAHTWSWDKEDIGTYVDYDKKVAEYTVKVEGDELYDVIGTAALKGFELFAYIDGRDTSSAIDPVDCAEQVDEATYNKSEEKILNSGNGVLTQVFVDTAEEEITVVSINTYLAIATADYNTSKETLSIEVYSYDFNEDEYEAGISTITSLDGEDYDVADYEEGDVMLVTIADGEVQDIIEPEYVADTAVTEFSTKRGDNNASETSKVTFGGTSYNYNLTAMYDEDTLYEYDSQLMVDRTYNFYLDQYGYVIGAEEASAELQYVFITAVDYIYSNLVNATATATAIFPDGEMTNIKINVKKTNDIIEDLVADGAYEADDVGSEELNLYKLFNSETTEEGAKAEYWNTWYSYTVKDDVYTLTPVAEQGWQTTDGDDSYDINSSNSRLTDTEMRSDDDPLDPTAFGNSNSVYITVDTDEVGESIVIDDVTSTTTGIRNVDLAVPANDTDESRGVYFIWDSKDYVIAAVVVGDDNSTTKNYVYLLDETAESERYDGTNNYWKFSALVEGKDSTIQEIDESRWSKVSAAGYGLIRITLNADGYVVDAEDATDLVDGTIVIDDLADIQRGDTKAVELLNVEDDGDGDFAILYQKADTLYVNDQRSSNGLVMADDVSIVVIDDGDVDDSIANLKSALAAVDADLDVDECQFQGDVVAILNDRGEAEVLILDSSFEREDEGDGEEIGDYSSVVNTRYAGIEDLDLANAEIDDDGALTFPLVAGEDAYTQIKDALTYMGYKNIEASKKGTEYKITATKGGLSEEITCDTSVLDTYVVITVGTTKTYAKNDSTVADVTGVAENAANFVKSGDNFVSTDTVIVAGATYGTQAYVTFNEGSNTADDFDVAYTADGAAIEDGAKVKVGATIKATLTATADVTNPADSVVTKFSVAAGSDDTVTYNGELTTFAEETATQKLESNNTTISEKIVAEGETFTVTFDAKPALGGAYTAEAITVTAPANS